MSNAPVTDGITYVRALRDNIERTRELEEERTLAFLEWSLRVPEPKTGTLNFDRFPFQPDIYNIVGDDRYRDVVVRKSTQVGMSAMLVRWGLYEPDRNGRTMLYVFPTLGDVHDFSDARVSPMVEGSEYLQQRKGDPFNKGLKRLGRGLAYFRGSENKRGLDSVDADGLALDEYDTLNQANIPDAERRLSGPMSAGLVRRVGVPSLPEFGIADMYDKSDQRKWLVQCKRCDHRGTSRERGGEHLRTPRGTGWQEIDFWDNVDQERKRIVCAGCGQPLNLTKGKWVAQNPGSEVPGFHVSRLMVPGIRLDGVIAASLKTTPYEMEVFYNKDLGLPYVSKVARLSPEEVAAAQRNFAMVPGCVPENGEYVTMGIDVASERALNVRISLHPRDAGGRKFAMWIGEVEDGPEGDAFEQLDLLMARFNVHMAVIDARPETRLARAFQQRHRGRVYLSNYSQNAKQAFSFDQEMGELTVLRTLAIDAMVEQIRTQRNLLPIALPAGYVSHLTANIRRVIVDDVTQEKKVFWEATRPDDYAQAEVYDMLAEHVYLVRQRILDEQDESTTPLDAMIDVRRYDLSPDADYHSGPGMEEGGLGGGMYYDESG